MDYVREARAVADSVFMDDGEMQAASEAAEGEGEEEMMLTDLPIDAELIEKLHYYDIWTVEEFINLTDAEFANMHDESHDLSADEIARINEVIRENVDIIEDEVEAEEGGETFACPECGYPLTIGMTECPHCHVGISFE